MNNKLNKKLSNNNSLNNNIKNSNLNKNIKNNSLNNNIKNNSLNNNIKNNSLNKNIKNNSLNKNIKNNNLNNNIKNNNLNNTPIVTSPITTTDSKQSPTFLITTLFLVIIVLLFIIIIPTYVINNTKENFDNSQAQTSFGTIFQSGIGGISPSGNITFNTPYKNPPQVFTQIIGNQSNLINVYSIIVFNVTNTGFSYIKNMVAYPSGTSTDGKTYDIAKLQNDNLLQFNWIAMGQ